MGDSWDRTIFDKELKSILDSKLPVSASKVASLQSLAVAHPQHHNYIVHCIIRFIETAPPDYRLAGLYVVDSISRAVYKQVRKSAESGEPRPVETEPYLRRFAIVLRDDALLGCFAHCTAKDKEKVKRTLEIWEQGGVYSKELVEYIKQSFMKVAGSSTDGPTMSAPTFTTNVDTAQASKVAPTPAVDAATLLAQLSNISGGNLANLTASLPSATAASVATQQGYQSSTAPSAIDNNQLPPAIARLLGGMMSIPSSSTPSSAAPMVPMPPQQPLLNSNYGGTQYKLPNPDAGAVSSLSVETPPHSAVAQSITDPRLRRQHSPPARPIEPRAQHSPRAAPPGGMPLGRQQYPGSTMPIQQQPMPKTTSSTRTRPSRWNVDDSRPPAENNIPSASRWSEPGPAPYHPPPPPPPRDHVMDGNRTQRRDLLDAPRPFTPNINMPGPVPDPSLPPGTIRVLTRTLFVGPLPEHSSQRDVAKLFEKYGELCSIILTRKTKVKMNAFIKFATRASIEDAIHSTTDLVLEGMSVKVNWAYGFGPKKLFNYALGESIIPLNELSENEKSSLTAAPIGGFQGQPVRDQMTIEEPEAQYRPDWKKDELNQKPQRHQQRGGSGNGGPGVGVVGSSSGSGSGSGSGSHNDHYHQQPPHGRPKRRRFDGPPSHRGIDDMPASPHNNDWMPPFQQNQVQQQQRMQNQSQPPFFYDGPPPPQQQHHSLPPPHQQQQHHIPYQEPHYPPYPGDY